MPKVKTSISAMRVCVGVLPDASLAMASAGSGCRDRLAAKPVPTKPVRKPFRLISMDILSLPIGDYTTDFNTLSI